MRRLIDAWRNTQGFTLLEILLAATVLCVAVAFLTKIFYGVGSVSADSKSETQKILIAQSAMEITVAGIMDNLAVYKGSNINFQPDVPKDITIVDNGTTKLVEPGSGITLSVQVTRTDNLNSTSTKVLKDFKIEVTVNDSSDPDRAYRLTSYLLGV